MVGLAPELVAMRTTVLYISMDESGRWWLIGIFGDWVWSEESERLFVYLDKGSHGRRGSGTRGT